MLVLVAEGCVFLVLDFVCLFVIVASVFVLILRVFCGLF